MNVRILVTTVEQEPVLTWNRPSDVTVQMVTDSVAHLKCLLVMVGLFSSLFSFSTRQVEVFL